MTSWGRNPENQRLVRSEPDPNLEPESKPKFELGNMAQKRTLSDSFYHSTTAFASHILLC